MKNKVSFKEQLKSIIKGTSVYKKEQRVLVIAVLLWFRLYGRTRRYGRASSKRYRQHTYRGRRR